MSVSLMYNPSVAPFSSDSFLFQFIGAIVRAVSTPVMEYVPKQWQLKLEKQKKSPPQDVADIYGFMNCSFNAFSTFLSYKLYEICFNF